MQSDHVTIELPSDDLAISYPERWSVVSLLVQVLVECEIDPTRAHEYRLESLGGNHLPATVECREVVGERVRLVHHHPDR